MRSEVLTSQKYNGVHVISHFSSKTLLFFPFHDTENTMFLKMGQPVIVMIFVTVCILKISKSIFCDVFVKKFRGLHIYR